MVVILWDLTQRREMSRVTAPAPCVRGRLASARGTVALSCGNSLWLSPLGTSLAWRSHGLHGDVRDVRRVSLDILALMGDGTIVAVTDGDRVVQRIDLEGRRPLGFGNGPSERIAVMLAPSGSGSAAEVWIEDSSTATGGRRTRPSRAAR